jgi:integrase
MATIRKLRGKWQAQVRRKGMAPRAKSFTSKQDAERWARDLEAQLDRAGALPDTRLAERTTLADVLTRYRDEITPKKRSSVSESARIAGILRRPICHRTLTILSTADLSTYRDERLLEVAPATVIRELNTISHAIDTARRDWGVHLVQNPCKLVRRPSPPRGRTRRLVGDEEQRLLAAADAGRVAYLRPLITLAIETGMRRGELLGLEWRHVDLDTRVAHLPLTKNGESRDVPLSTRAVATLRSLQTKDGRVFAVAPNAVRLAWERLVRRAGLSGLHLHDLRHEAISRLFERGFNVVEVSSISGHKELRMLQRYTHLRAADLAERLANRDTGEPVCDAFRRRSAIPRYVQISNGGRRCVSQMRKKQCRTRCGRPNCVPRVVPKWGGEKAFSGTPQRCRGDTAREACSRECAL